MSDKNTDGIENTVSNSAFIETLNAPLKYINDHGKECYKNVDHNTKMSTLEFHQVLPSFEDDPQYALHTNLGTLTVVNRITGFGCSDIETGYRSPDGKFWLASGDYDVRDLASATIGEAIQWVKERANNCKGI